MAGLIVNSAAHGSSYAAAGGYDADQASCPQSITYYKGEGDIAPGVDGIGVYRLACLVNNAYEERVPTDEEIIEAFDKIKQKGEYVDVEDAYAAARREVTKQTLVVGQELAGAGLGTGPVKVEKLLPEKLGFIGRIDNQVLVVIRGTEAILSREFFVYDLTTPQYPFGEGLRGHVHYGFSKKYQDVLHESVIDALHEAHRGAAPGTLRIVGPQLGCCFSEHWLCQGMYLC